MGIKQKLRNLFPRYEKSSAHESDLMVVGETLLSVKMMMWDSEKFPFIPTNWDDYGF